VRQWNARVGVTLALVLLFATLSILPSLLSPVRAQDAQTLAQEYSPELQFARGEQFYPTTVDYLIGSSTLMLRASDGTSSPVNATISASNLGNYSNPNYFLDNRFGTQDAIAADYATNGEPRGYFSYVNVVNTGSGTVLQYWFFYAYNNGLLNDHQGDFEVVEVFLDQSGAPQTALYSQHFAGENAAWGDVEKVGGTHPVVYVALGSHANYFRPYQGKIGIENDIVGNDGLLVSPGQLILVMLSNQSWLGFQGRWGYWGTDLEVAQGKAGPYGPVFNQGGIRWAQPESYLSQTLPVGGYYFDPGWVAANLLLLFILYTVVRGAWKIVGIIRLKRKGVLAGTRLFKGRLGAGVALVMVGVILMVAGLFLPWYDVSTTSSTGPLGSLGTVDLVHLDGITGLVINFFAGSSSDASSGFSTLFTSQLPFSLFLGAGVVLLILDVVGFQAGKKLGRKFLAGAVATLLPFVLIYVLMSQISLLLPFASLLLPGQSVPPGVAALLQSIASNPIGGTASQVFPVVGNTTVQWGFGLGAYLFIAAALLRLIGACLVWTAKPLGPSGPSEAGATPTQQ